MSDEWTVKVTKFVQRVCERSAGRNENGRACNLRRSPVGRSTDELVDLPGFRGMAIFGIEMR